MSEMNKSRNIGIDITKFICALFVVMIHVAPMGVNSGSIIAKGINFGLQQYVCRIAVPFFFVCNGYFLFKKVNTDKNDFKQLYIYIYSNKAVFDLVSDIYASDLKRYNLVGKGHSAWNCRFYPVFPVYRQLYSSLVFKKCCCGFDNYCLFA